MARVLIGLSGGVDSAVAALLLKEQGHDVVGVFMRNGVEAPAGARTCCGVDDAHDARRVADLLGIPFYALDFEREFADLIADFVESYRRGETPNPCVRCNRLLKFGRVFEFADAVGAEFVATGHYARIEDGAVLRRGADPAKDQSYMLFNISRHRLPRILFPLGTWRKQDVRRRAREAGFAVCEKPDSRGVCFIPDGDLSAFLRRRIAPAPGEIRTPDGTTVGRHDGIHFFTVGQRRGTAVALGTPRYVARLDPLRREVTVAPDEVLWVRTARVRELNWLADVELPARAHVQIRYRSAPQPALLVGDGTDGVRIEFENPVRAPTPGQAAVFYDGDVVLGGGWIAA